MSIHWFEQGQYSRCLVVCCDVWYVFWLGFFGGTLVYWGGYVSMGGILLVWVMLVNTKHEEHTYYKHAWPIPNGYIQFLVDSEYGMVVKLMRATSHLRTLCLCLLSFILKYDLLISNDNNCRHLGTTMKGENVPIAVDVDFRIEGSKDWLLLVCWVVMCYAIVIIGHDRRRLGLAS